MVAVSVIINCYNGEKFLEKAINSIYAQTFSDWEIIFFDNKSSDRSASIAKKFDRKLKYYCATKHISLGEARNEAILLCSGKWVCFLDVDDLWDNNKLETQINAINNTNYILTYAGIRLIDKEGLEFGIDLPLNKTGNMLGQLLRRFEINMVTPLINLEKMRFLKINFDPSFIASEEYNLFMRLACKGEFLVINECLGSYRVSDFSLTTQAKKKWSEERLNTLKLITKENKNLHKEYYRDFNEAFAKGLYYSARYEIEEGNKEKGRKKLLEAFKYNKIYIIFYLLSFNIFLWKYVHNFKIKRTLTKILIKFKVL